MPLPARELPQLLSHQEHLAFFQLFSQAEGDDFQRLSRAAEILGRALALKWGVPVAPTVAAGPLAGSSGAQQLQAAQKLFAQAQDPATDFTAPQRFHGAVGYPAPVSRTEDLNYTVGPPAKASSPDPACQPTPRPQDGMPAGQDQADEAPDLPFGTLQVMAKRIVFGGGTAHYPRAVVLQAQRLANSLDALVSPSPVRAQDLDQAIRGLDSMQ